MILRLGIKRIGLQNVLRNQFLINPTKFFFSADNKNSNNEANQSQKSTEMIEAEYQDEKNLQTMKKNYQEVEVQSFKGKSFSNLTQLQKKIIQQGKFDLNHPEIKPKLASINSIPGLTTTQNITQIDLGNIKIKQKNQVFLSEIDPYNIPQDYEIRFDEQKKLTIVGKKIEKQKKTGQEPTDMVKNSQMPISMAESFQQKSLGELSQKYMGQIGYKYQFNRKRSFKEALLAIPLMILFFSPLFSTLDQVYECIVSIQEIEDQQMKEIKKIKKSRMVHVLINNKDFNQMI